jgi:putative DNA methylase
VIFCQRVDDPSAVPEEFPTEEAQENERLRLFAMISELVQWENTTNEKVLNRAREKIRRSWRRCCADNADHPEAAELFNPEKLPGFHDPFAGGGALPLEAQRLGLEAYASDLNPVAVLMKIARIEAQSSKRAGVKLFPIDYRKGRGRIYLIDFNSQQFKAALVR